MEEIKTEKGMNPGKFGKMKKKMCPEAKDPAVAMRDKFGNLVTCKNGIKNLYEQTYNERLQHNSLRDGLEDLGIYEQKLFEERIHFASKNKTDPWTKHDLIKVLKGMKKGKARDPHGFINEIFKSEVAGDNLIDGLLLLFNEVKKQQNVPNIFEFANMTDCNVGAIKGRNHRDNLFVLFDVVKFFDKLWLQETLNDLFEAGITNVKLVLIYKENQKNSIAIKTPFGITKRFDVEDIIMQGTVFGPLKCTTSMNQLGAMAYKRGTPLLAYKETVQIPVLGMIDDLATVTKCGKESIVSNSITNTFIESKRTVFVNC